MLRPAQKMASRPVRSHPGRPGPGHQVSVRSKSLVRALAGMPTHRVGEFKTQGLRPLILAGNALMLALREADPLNEVFLELMARTANRALPLTA